MIFSDEQIKYLEKFKSEVIAEAESVLNSNLDDYHASMSADFDARIKKLNAYRESLDEYKNDTKKNFIDYCERVEAGFKYDRDENRTRHQEMLRQLRINSIALIQASTDFSTDDSMIPESTRIIDTIDASLTNKKG